MPCFRHRSLADIPAACSFNTLIICSYVNLPLRIVCLLAGEQNPNSKSGAFQGSRSPRLHVALTTFIGGVILVLNAKTRPAATSLSMAKSWHLLAAFGWLS